MREDTSLEENTLSVLEEFPRSSKQPLPKELPEHLVTLHQHLSQSPLLAQSTLRIYTPSSFKSRNLNDDLTLPYSRAKGRRRRGVHDAGESVGEPNDMWNWYVLAEVKEGTEGRGAIEAVIRSAQKELLQSYPHLPIPKKLSRKRTEDGWGVLDIGDSLLHIVSREASQKWFSVASNNI